MPEMIFSSFKEEFLFVFSKLCLIYIGYSLDINNNASDNKSKAVQCKIINGMP